MNEKQINAINKFIGDNLATIDFDKYPMLLDNLDLENKQEILKKSFDERKFISLNKTILDDDDLIEYFVRSGFAEYFAENIDEQDSRLVSFFNEIVHIMYKKGMKDDLEKIYIKLLNNKKCKLPYMVEFSQSMDKYYNEAINKDILSASKILTLLDDKEIDAKFNFDKDILKRFIKNNEEILSITINIMSKNYKLYVEFLKALNDVDNLENISISFCFKYSDFDTFVKVYESKGNIRCRFDHDFKMKAKEREYVLRNKIKYLYSDIELNTKLFKIFVENSSSEEEFKDIYSFKRIKIDEKSQLSLFDKTQDKKFIGLILTKIGYDNLYPKVVLRIVRGEEFKKMNINLLKTVMGNIDFLEREDFKVLNRYKGPISALCTTEKHKLINTLIEKDIDFKVIPLCSSASMLNRTNQFYLTVNTNNNFFDGDEDIKIAELFLTDLFEIARLKSLRSNKLYKKLLLLEL